MYPLNYYNFSYTQVWQYNVHEVVMLASDHDLEKVGNQSNVFWAGNENQCRK